MKPRAISPEDQLRQAATVGDISAVNKLFKKNPRLDVNAQDPISGRTALHCAYLDGDKYSEMQTLLRNRYTASLHVRDKEGFTPIELAYNPHPYDAKNIPTFERQQYQHFAIDGANKYLEELKLEEKRSLVLIHHVSEIPEYLDQNPHQNRVGFVVRKPNCIIKVDHREKHFSPIYFERRKDHEFFIQLDATSYNYYVIPEPKKAARSHHYVKLLRQAQNTGCFEDAISVLVKMLREKEVLSFFVKNRKKVETPKELEEKDFAELDDLESRDDQLSNAERNRKYDLRERSNMYLQTNLFLVEHNFKPTAAIYEITTLPDYLLANIERYDSMRQMKHIFSNKNDTTEKVLQQLFLKGKIRHQNKVTSLEVRNNLNNPDPQYDFCGFDFQERMMSGLIKFNTAEYKNTCRNMERFLDRRLGLFWARERDIIADRIAAMLTGYDGPKRIRAQFALQ